MRGCKLRVRTNANRIISIVNATRCFPLMSKLGFTSPIESNKYLFCVSLWAGGEDEFILFFYCRLKVGGEERVGEEEPCKFGS